MQRTGVQVGAWCVRGKGARPPTPEGAGEGTPPCPTPCERREFWSC